MTAQASLATPGTFIRDYQLDVWHRLGSKCKESRNLIGIRGRDYVRMESSDTDPKDWPIAAGRLCKECEG